MLTPFNPYTLCKFYQLSFISKNHLLPLAVMSCHQPPSGEFQNSLSLTFTTLTLISQCVPQFGVVRCFLPSRFKLGIFERMFQKLRCLLSTACQWHPVSIYLTAEAVNFNHLIKLVSTELIYCQLIPLSLIINKHFEEKSIEIM